MKPQRKNIKTLLEGKFFQYQLVSFTDERGKSRTWETVGRKKGTSVVVVFAVTDNDELILEKQYRPPLHRYVLELPAGLKERKDKTYVAAAKRELLEETGWNSKKMRLAGIFPLSAGMSGDIIHFFIASSLSFQGANPEEGEHIETLLIPISELTMHLHRAKKKKILIDPYILIGLQLY